MIVYVARVIPAFVMYCVNGASGSSPLIESTESMMKCIIVRYFGNGVYMVHSEIKGAMQLHTCMTIVVQFHLSGRRNAY